MSDVLLSDVPYRTWIGQPPLGCFTIAWLAVVLLTAAAPSHGEDWPRWRGPDGAGVSAETGLVLNWSTTRNVRWQAEIPGEGSSSPIVWGDRLFVTSALDEGTRRQLHCLHRDTGKRLWTREIIDQRPEIASALTGHAAATPVTDGRKVVAFFGNAGLVAYDFQGRQHWHRDFGEFESELGLASSPLLIGNRVFQLCDHDGKFYRTFDSFLICLDLANGRTLWKANRRGLERSWSTPILVPLDHKLPHVRRYELIVNAQDELRAYSPVDGSLRWRVRGMTGWVTPSPVSADGLIFATSGKNGPLMAVRPNGKGDVTETMVAWQHPLGGPYVCSPVVSNKRLYVVNETGILNCYRAASGERLFRQRLSGKFTASPVVADGHLLVTNESGTTYVIAEGDDYRLVAENQLPAECLASPAFSDGKIFIRAGSQLWCLAKPRANEADPPNVCAVNLITE